MPIYIGFSKIASAPIGSQIIPFCILSARMVHTKARVHTHGDLHSIASDPANMAAAREDYLRPVLYKWGKVLTELYRPAFEKLGSKTPSADVDFILHTINGLLVAQLSFPRRDFEKRILRPAIERLIGQHCLVVT